MTDSPKKLPNVPAVVQAFASQRVMAGLRPTGGGSADPQGRFARSCTPAQAIGYLMRAVAQRTEQDL